MKTPTLEQVKEQVRKHEREKGYMDTIRDSQIEAVYNAFKNLIEKED